MVILGSSGWYFPGPDFVQAEANSRKDNAIGAKVGLACMVFVRLVRLSCKYITFLKILKTLLLFLIKNILNLKSNV